jgi:hypothetical protein
MLYPTELRALRVLLAFRDGGPTATVRFYHLFTSGGGIGLIVPRAADGNRPANQTSYRAGSFSGHRTIIIQDRRNVNKVVYEGLAARFCSAARRRCISLASPHVQPRWARISLTVGMPGGRPQRR